MDSLHYLLPLLLILPIAFNKLSGRYPRFNFTPLQLLGPLAFLGLAALSYIQKNPVQLTFWDFSNYFSLGLKLDVLSGLIATTVSTIGIVVTRFSIRYLEDDPNRTVFSNNLSYTLSFVLSMLLAPNLILLFLSWVGTSYFLHHLLAHFSERPGAMKAAQQKFWVSRLGDVFIASAGALLLIAFDSLEFDVILQMTKNSLFLEENYLFINAASVFLVLGAMTKSAQFPFHFWLPNTMETPTPVSAIMHAGIINAGGYLVIRMSPVLSNAPLALSILAILGGFTAFWASIVMFTQPNIKRNLAYSTISQMGFMMLQCGLGAFSIAVVHIIGHAFYKAYAFLSSGTATDFGRLNRYFPKPKVSQSLWAPFILGCLSVTLVLGSLIYSGHRILENPGVMILLLILALAASQIILNSKDKMRALLSAISLVILYLVLTSFMTLLLEGITPVQVSVDGALGLVTLTVCSAFFIALYLIQNTLNKISETRIGKQIYVKALRGGF